MRNPKLEWWRDVILQRPANLEHAQVMGIKETTGDFQTVLLDEMTQRDFGRELVERWAFAYPWKRKGFSNNR